MPLHWKQTFSPGPGPSTAGLSDEEEALPVATLLSPAASFFPQPANSNAQQQHEKARQALKHMPGRTNLLTE
jgi:hypothetical protein